MPAFNLKEIKQRAMNGAMKLMQTDTAQKVMSKPEFQKAMAWAFQTSVKVKDNIEDTKKKLAKRFAVATEDDLKDLKRTIARLERKVKKMDSKSKDGGSKSSTS